jgi:hypothetical protein
MLDFPKNGVPQVQNGTHTVRFGAFEADLHSGEVRKSGIRIKLQEQPFKVLPVTWSLAKNCNPEFGPKRTSAISTTP